MPYDKCSICGNKQTWVAAVIKPGTQDTEIYDALCRDCYMGVEMERNNVMEKIKDELRNGWLKKIKNLPTK